MITERIRRGRGESCPQSRSRVAVPQIINRLWIAAPRPHLGIVHLTPNPEITCAPAAGGSGQCECVRNRLRPGRTTGTEWPCCHSHCVTRWQRIYRHTRGRCGEHGSPTRSCTCSLASTRLFASGFGLAHSPINTLYTCLCATRIDEHSEIAETRSREFADCDTWYRFEGCK